MTTTAPAKTLTDGSPVTPDHADIDPATGLQKGYVVLSAEERAKGFVAPVRRTYLHAGLRPTGKTRPLTPDEQKRYADMDYVLYEEYADKDSSAAGRFWTQAQLNSGCHHTTTMNLALAETYARDPKFYGATFCSVCKNHYPVDEFVWQGTDQRVGSMPPEAPEQCEAEPSPESFPSTDDKRTQNNALRHQYRTLTDAEKAQMQALKDAGQVMLDLVSEFGSSREISLAKTKIEEAVMWGCKHVKA